MNEDSVELVVLDTLAAVDALVGVGTEQMLSPLGPSAFTGWAHSLFRYGNRFLPLHCNFLFMGVFVSGSVNLDGACYFESSRSYPKAVFRIVDASRFVAASHEYGSRYLVE